jgi:hypothetical protein
MSICMSHQRLKEHLVHASIFAFVVLHIEIGFPFPGLSCMSFVAETGAEHSGRLCASNTQRWTPFQYICRSCGPSCCLLGILLIAASLLWFYLPSMETMSKYTMNIIDTCLLRAYPPVEIAVRGLIWRVRHSIS